LLAHEAKNVGFEWVRSHRGFLVAVDGAIKAEAAQLACYSARASLNLAVVLSFRAGQRDVVDLYRFHSIRVNQQWRLIFRWDGARGEARDLYLDDHSYS
jgi:hypothetical protein